MEFTVTYIADSQGRHKAYGVDAESESAARLVWEENFPYLEIVSITLGQYTPDM